MSTPLPAGFRISLDPDAKQLDDTTWFGGSPERIIRLSKAGRHAFTELLNGPVESDNAAILARRLTDAGLAHPHPPESTTPDVTVVIPVRDRADLLDRCLTALGSTYPVIVVDDGSRNPDAIAALARRHDAILLRRTVNGGAGPARNTGLASVTTELVAFVDSDTEPTGDWIRELAAHFADPLTAAVAPRVAGVLDLGDRPARVMPNARVAYVPTAALLVRGTALTEVGAFDEEIERGEDTDLIWRLHEAGWRIRYDPTAVIHHNEATTWSALLSRRFRYGKSAAPLAVRHPAAIRPLVLYPWPALTVVALLARKPWLALIAYGGSVLAMSRALRKANAPTGDVPKAMLDASYRTWLGIGRYSVQYAAPVLAVALLAPGNRWRRTMAAALLLGQLRRIPGDIAYGAGVWHGCATERTLKPIRPTIAWRPLRAG